MALKSKHDARIKELEQVTLERASVSAHRLTLDPPLRTSATRLSVRPLFILRLEAAGNFGLGEAAPAFWLGESSIETVGDQLERLCSAVNTKPISLLGLLSAGDQYCFGSDIDGGSDAGSVGTSDVARSTTAHVIGKTALGSMAAAVRAALQAALFDLCARIVDRPVFSVLSNSSSGDKDYKIDLSRLLSEQSPEAISESIKRGIDDGIVSFKLKVGSSFSANDKRNLDYDRSRIKAGLDALNGRARLRLDANRAWTLSQAQVALGNWDTMAIEFIEEPLKEADPEQYACLYESTGVPLALDESISTSEDLSVWLKARAAHALVLKPQRVGGIGAALGLGRMAAAANMYSVVTDSIESGVGARACAHLAAALAGDYAKDTASANPETAPPAVGLGGQALAGALDDDLYSATEVSPITRRPTPQLSQVFVCGPGLGLRT